MNGINENKFTKLADGNFGFSKVGRIRFKQQKRRQLLAEQFGLKRIEQLRWVTGKPCLFQDEVACKKKMMFPRCPRVRLKHLEKLKTSINQINNENTEMVTVYKDSTLFLKGTQSANPHNDYCQHFVDTGERPQNFIRDTGLKHRFEEYPKLHELIRLKDELISSTATPPMYLKTDLMTYDLRDLQCKFDVILIEPPLEEYNRTNGSVYDRYWDWDEIEKLEIEQIAAQRSFLWIWCGSGEGLDKARKCLRKWGFRRCEDICWIKTNKKNPGHKNLEPGAIFQRSKEHCLMGIKGTVRRSTDGDFIHANVDIDLIIEEEASSGCKDKPVEIFHMIEHFCLGRRRLHLFGRDTTIRKGWLTVGPELTATNFDTRIYSGYFTKDPNGTVTGCTEEIERLRPKSPPPRQKPGQANNANDDTQISNQETQSSGQQSNFPGSFSSANELSSHSHLPVSSASLFPPYGPHHTHIAAVNHAMAQAAALSVLTSPFANFLPHPTAAAALPLPHFSPFLAGGNSDFLFDTRSSRSSWPISDVSSLGAINSSRSSRQSSSRRDWNR